ncbi:MAG: helix-turn-helix domain-containing protein, partial [Mycobacterium sp.]
VRAGILEPTETSEVRDAIVTDAAISERQKQVLLDIYTSFCQQNEAALIDAAVAAGASANTVSEADEEPTTEQDPSPVQSPLQLTQSPSTDSKP